MKKRVIKLTENQLSKIVKSVLNEAYTGIIQIGDDLCEIECERKIAAYGSNGDAVKEIQHALSKCGFNAKYEGGGMNEGCGENRKNCDGKFREHTRDSVKEFQRENGLTVDGKVGSDTLKKLVSEGCLDDPECDCEEQDFDQEFEQDDTKEDYVKQFDCEEVKHCMQKYLFASPVPDYSGFMQCILNNAIKDIDKRTDYDYKYKDGKLTQCSWYVDGINRYKCPEYMDCMPKIGGIDKNCNSIAIRACIKAGCTKKAV